MRKEFGVHESRLKFVEGPFVVMSGNSFLEEAEQIDRLDDGDITTTFSLSVSFLYVQEVDFVRHLHASFFTCLNETD